MPLFIWALTDNYKGKTMKLKLILILVLFMNAPIILSTEIIFLNDESASNNTYPFSKATQVGEILFLSGELGVDPKTGKLVEGGIVKETKQVMKNISSTLKKYNSSLDRVAKCTVFLADIKEWSKFNEVYKTFFTKNYPARSAMAGSGLGLSARVEVECIAVVNDQKN